jgi:putative colanic acid biosynthesis UDP-glucose lipid carrier transferase
LAAKTNHYIKQIAITGDFILLWLFFVVGFIYFDNANLALEPFYWKFYAYLTLAWLVLSIAFGIFRQGIEASKLTLLSAYTKLVVFFFFAFLLYFQVYDFGYYPRSFIRILFPAFFASLLLWKFGLRYIYYAYRKRGINNKNALLIGSSMQAVELEAYLKHNFWHGYNLIGALPGTKDTATHQEKWDHLIQMMEEYDIDELFIALEDLLKMDKLELNTLLTRFPVKLNIIPNLDNFVFEKIELQEFGNVPVLKIHTGPLSFWYNRWVKRLFDLVISTLVIATVLSWMTLLLYFLDLFGKRQGVFFRQQRTSMYGRTFTIIKYRSMVQNDDADLKQATANDARITPVGGFLRRTSLDELPQFINVFLGQMSVVNPRPHMLIHTEQYSRVVHSFMLRHTIKPGITGLAQVKGYRGEVKAPEDIKKRVEMDVYYIRNWSMNLDIWIVIKTAWLVLKPS